MFILAAALLVIEEPLSRVSGLPLLAIKRE